MHETVVTVFNPENRRRGEMAELAVVMGYVFFNRDHTIAVLSWLVYGRGLEQESFTRVMIRGTDGGWRNQPRWIMP
jgi:hypothetical protein